jgi:hypothetical protein
MKVTAIYLAAAIGLGAGVPIGSAAPIDPNLSGNKLYDGWDFTQFNANQYGSFADTSAWSIDSNLAGSDVVGHAQFNKAAGSGGYTAGNSNGVYVASFDVTPGAWGGTFSVTEVAPVADLQTVVVQIDTGPAFGFDFYQGLLPTLSYNGGAQSLAADISGLISHVQTGTFTPPGQPEQPVYDNLWLVQWDLSSVAAPIGSFAVSWSATAHSQIHAVRLDQSDTFSAVPVPEPAMLGLLAMGGLVLLRRSGR